MSRERSDRSQQSRWGDALADLFAPDPETGWMDTSEALEAMAWLGRQVYEQTRVDRATWGRAALLTQIERAEAVASTLDAAQTVRIAQFAATTVDDPIGRAAGLADPPLGGDGIASPVDPSERLHPLGHKAPFADEEIAAALCLTPAQGTARTEEAIDAATKTPRLLDRAGAGDLDRCRLAQVTRELIEAGPHTCELVENALLTGGVTSWTSRRIRHRTSCLMQRLDPPAARMARRTRAREAINVRTCPGQVSGTTEWTAILRPSAAAPARQAVEELARALHADTTTDKTLGECRADAMTDLILGHAHVDTHLTLLVPVTATGHGEHADRPTPPQRAATEPTTSTVRAHRARPTPAHCDPPACAADGIEVDRDGELDDLIRRIRRRWIARADQHRTLHTADDGDSGDASPPGPAGSGGDSGDPDGAALGAVEVPGIGIIPASVVRAMTRDLGARITRCLVDSADGTLISSSSAGYRPGAAMRRLIDRRDQHCRFPSCDRDARYCDADHVIPWPRGETTPGNLQLLCRHHHRAKHEAGWSVTMTVGGVCTWVSPTGRSYTTRPGLTDVTSELRLSPGTAPLRHAPDRDSWEPAGLAARAAC